MVNWGPPTVISVFAGMLYGGSREASSSVVSFSPYIVYLFVRNLVGTT